MEENNIENNKASDGLTYDEKKLYYILKNKRKTYIKRDMFKEFGGMLISFYLILSSLVLGQIISFFYLFILNDVSKIVFANFGIYTSIIAHGMLSCSLTMLLFIFGVIGIDLYHKSQSLIDSDKKNKLMTKE